MMPLQLTRSASAMAPIRAAANAQLTRWHWALFVFLQCFSLYQILHHAMWRDELQIWSLVRESGSLPELIHNMRYDGFPPLWYICLWFISLVTTAPVAMQLFHFLCSFAAQLLVMTRAPFSGAMKLAVVAGYYISFEYCLMSRAYVLGVLLIFFACAYRSWLETRPLLRALIWGALANSSIYGAILSLAFVADELVSFITGWRGAGGERGRSLKNLAGFLAVYGLLLAAAVACMVPPADGNFSEGWRLHPGMNELIYQFCRNLIFLVPIPLAKPTFWNTLALTDFTGFSRWMILPTATAILAMVWLALRPSPRHLRLFLLGFAGIWLFTVVKYYGFIRHVGAEAILLLACLWLAAEKQASPGTPPCRWSRPAVWALLSLQLLAWGIASWYHLRYDFSGSREMAGIIRALGDDRAAIVADADNAASSVAGYLNRPLYYASNGKAQTYIRWNRERTGGGIENAVSLARELAAGNDRRVLLLLNYPLENGPVRFLARSRDAIVADEVFYLYEYLR